MNKLLAPRPNYHYFFIVLIALLLTGAVIVFNQTHSTHPAKNAPIDPLVIEQMKQARSLQKLGKLEDSAALFEKYALQGFPDAMFFTAKAYSKGWGVPPNLEKARHYLLRAIEYDFAYRGESAFQLGRLYQRSVGPDCNRIAIEWFRKSLKWHYLKSTVELGRHYEKGLGVEQDIDQAIYYYEVATNAGIASAALKYARILTTGRYGVKTNRLHAQYLTDVAIKELEKQAHLGKASPAKTLGRLYRDGVLVKINNDKAIYWLSISANGGNPGAMHDLGHLLLTVYPQESTKQAIRWLERAATLNHGGAATSLGRFHLSEQYGLAKNSAVYWFNKGIETGHGGSIQEMAKLLFTGILVPENKTTAIELLKKGKKLGHAGSARLLSKYQKQLNSPAIQTSIISSGDTNSMPASSTTSNNHR